MKSSRRFCLSLKVNLPLSVVLLKRTKGKVSHRIRQSSDVIMLWWVPTFVFVLHTGALFNISDIFSASYHHQDVVWPCFLNLQSLRYTSLRLHVQNPLSIIKAEGIISGFLLLWCSFQAVSSLQLRWDIFTSDSGWPWMQTAVAKGHHARFLLDFANMLVFKRSPLSFYFEYEHINNSE